MTDITNTTPDEGFMSSTEFHKKLEAAQNQAVESQESEQPAPVESEAEDETPETEAPEETTETTSESDTETPELDAKPIPPKRLKKEIDARKAAVSKAEKATEEAMRYKVQYEELLKGFQTVTNATQPQAQTPQAPNGSIDPIDSEAHAFYMEKIKQLEQAQTQTTQLTQHQMFVNTLKTQESAFEANNPDYNDALSHVIDVKTKEFADYFEPEVAKQKATELMLFMANQALQQGKSVPEKFYNLAKTYGYSTKGKKAAPGGPDLERIAANQKKSAGVSDYAGAEAPLNRNNLKPMEQMLTKHGEVDPKAFAERLKAIQTRQV